MSGGEQQMLAIGRALMAEPKLLLLDEPSMGLAPVLVERIYETIAEINRQGTTILLVEQNANFALEVSTRGYVLETGKVALTDESDGAARQPRGPEGVPGRMTDRHRPTRRQGALPAVRLAALGCIAASWLSARKGYGEKVGLATRAAPRRGGDRGLAGLAGAGRTRAGSSRAAALRQAAARRWPRRGPSSASATTTEGRRRQPGAPAWRPRRATRVARLRRAGLALAVLVLRRLRALVPRIQSAKDEERPRASAVLRRAPSSVRPLRPRSLRRRAAAGRAVDRRRCSLSWRSREAVAASSAASTTASP